MGHHEDDGECTNSYLAMLPRGLQQPIIESVSNLISPKSTFHLLHNEGSDQVIDQARRKLIEKAKKASNKKKKRNQINESWCQQPVGTIPLEPKFHVSLGYTKDGQSSWTCPGQVSGSVWLKIQTKDLVTSRCIGPLMSLVHVGKLSSDQNIMTSLQEVVAQIGTSIKTPTTNGNTTYRQDFDNAFRVWKQHVITQWKHQISTQDYAALKDRIEKNQLQFRLSCIREDSNVPYSRHDLLNELMQQHENILIPYRQQWTVSLKSFDMEIVLIILSNGQIAFGIALQPYSFLNSKSFAIGGVPPDISPPYLGGNILSDVVRLRPTTARILLELADCKPNQLIVDPCAGIGTIPVECERYFTFRSVGIGGDIVMDHNSMTSTALALEGVANNQLNNSFSRLSVAWDAAYLPLRTGIVDAVVSDLPFGKMCLSSHTMEKLLPLIIQECARILVPSTGRMLLLCGSPDSLVRALEEQSKYWKQPCKMLLPVNIGGLLAWICHVERSSTPYDRNEMSTKESKNLVRGMTKRRDVRRYHDSKKRRVQSKS